MSAQLVEALRLLLAKVRRDAPELSGKLLGECEAALAEAEAQPAKYADSTPHLNVGNSAFEHWFQAQQFATQTGIKQISRDSYAAGMGDPLVCAKAEAPTVAQPVAWLYWHPRDDTYDGPDTARKIAVSRFTDDTRRAMSLDGWLFEPLYRAAPPQPAAMTDEQIAALVLATVYDGDGSTPHRDAWATEIGIPFARAIERAHGIGGKA